MKKLWCFKYRSHIQTTGVYCLIRFDSKWWNTFLPIWSLSVHSRNNLFETSIQTETTTLHDKWLALAFSAVCRTTGNSEQAVSVPNNRRWFTVYISRAGRGDITSTDNRYQSAGLRRYGGDIAIQRCHLSLVNIWSLLQDYRGILHSTGLPGWNTSWEI